MATKKVMRLLDERTQRMECRVCGAEHIAQLDHGGAFKRGAWQCVNGCRLESKKKAEPSAKA